jgi:hypothetical protein
MSFVVVVGKKAEETERCRSSGALVFEQSPRPAARAFPRFDSKAGSSDLHFYHLKRR